MRFKMLLLALVALGIVLTVPVSAAPNSEKASYKPVKGDHVFLFHRKIKPANIHHVKSIFHGRLHNALHSDKEKTHSYWLVNEKNDTIISLVFAPAGQKSFHKNHPTYKGFNDALKSHLTQIPTIEHFVLVDINDEKHEPKVGSTVCVWERQLIPGTLENAKDIFMTKIFPHLAKDENSRDSYLLEDKDNSRLFIVAFMDGKFVQSKDLHKKLEALTPLSNGKMKLSQWKIFGIHKD